MKISLLTCLASAALALSVFGQTPTAPPDATAPPAPPVTTPAVAPAATAPGLEKSADDADDLEARINRKAKKHGLNITFGDDEKRNRDRDRDRDRDRVHVGGGDFDDGALMAIPIVGIIFTTLFGAPVMIVGLIMFFSYWKARSLHRTVRLMVEKGQPVPESLFAPPHSPARQRSDMRRGVVLVMVGIALMIFFGAVNDWDGGAWAIGIIPFLIGVGHLIVWKLEGPKEPDKAPPLP